MAADDIIDYVVVHELSHIRELNHSDKFWAVVKSVLPDYRERQSRLRELQNRIASLAFSLFFLMLFFSSCKQEPYKSALAFTVTDNNELGCVELYHPDYGIFRPFGIIGGKSSLRDVKISVRGGDSSADIYSIKDFDPTEWIIETDDGFMSVGDMIYKAVGVANIPDKLAKYKQHDFD